MCDSVGALREQSNSCSLAPTHSSLQDSLEVFEHVTGIHLVAHSPRWMGAKRRTSVLHGLGIRACSLLPVDV